MPCTMELGEALPQDTLIITKKTLTVPHTVHGY